MTFPLVPRDMATEIFVNGAWTDVSADVREVKGLTIGRGRHNYAGRIDPSSLVLSLLNTSGNYSPRNPSGAYWGSFDRNTPIRTSINRGIDQFTRTVSNGWGSSPAFGAWTSPLGSGGTVQASDYQVAGNVGTLSMPVANGYRLATLTGASYRDVDFVGQVTLPFTPVTGATIYPLCLAARAASATDFVYAAVGITTAGSITVGIYHLDGTVIVADTATGLTHASATAIKCRFMAEGHTFRAKVWQGASEPYGWSVSGHFTRNAAPGYLGVMQVVNTGNTNTKPIVASYDNLAWRQPRFAGEISSVKVGWDTSGKLVWSDIQAAGVKRRLGSRTTPLQSTYKRGNMLANPPAVAYWPCEEGSNATVINSAIGGPAMVVTGTTAFANYSGIAASLPLPQLNGSTWDSNGIPVYTPASPTQLQVRFLYRPPAAPATEIPNGSYLLDSHNTGTAGLWRITYRTGGDFGIEIWSSAFAGGPDIASFGPLGFADMRGKNWLVSLELTQNGANIDWKIANLEVGQDVGLVTGATVNTRTINLASRILVDPLGVCNGLIAGHIAVYRSVTSLFVINNELKAFVGELALDRMARLAAQQGIPFSYIGTSTDTPQMGPQPVAAFLDLMDQCADIDLGSLYEPRGDIGLEYRTTRSMMSQSSIFTLNYAAGHVDQPFEPEEDDQQTVNDVSVTRTAGSTARRVITSGRLSTSNPPTGVGTYDEADTVNAYSDNQIDSIASWKSQVGTYDETRYPTIAVNLANADVVAAGLDAAVLSANIDDRFSISNPFALQTPDQIDQLARGYFETINVLAHRLAFNCAAAAPYDLLRIGNTGLAYIDSDVSTVSGGPYASNATSIQVASLNGMIWVTGSGLSIPVFMAGELVTVTAISGASSPQTFTVVRSVNGVVKTQPTGGVVRTARRATIGI